MGRGPKDSNATLAEDELTDEPELDPARAGKVRLLLSGGGYRATVGSIGAILYLEQVGIWNQVTELVSVSGGSTTNAALLTVGMDGDEDITRLRILVQRLISDRARPWATPRRVFYTILIVFAVALCLLAPLILGGVIGPLSTRPIVAALAGVAMFPTAFQVARRLASHYLRDAIETPLQANGLSLSARHRERAARQHVFCASGLASGVPYYFWIGGEHFLATGNDADTVTAHQADKRWGVVANPTDHPEFTIGDVVFASSALPMMVGPKEPSIDSGMKERLIDGGASGVFGQQIRDPFWVAPGQEVHRSAHDHAHRVIAIDAMRSYRAGHPALHWLTNWVTGLGLLVRWIKIGGEALYVNDLLDTKDTALIRLCEPDLPPRKWQPPSGASWTQAWAQIEREQEKMRARDSDKHGVSLEDRLTSLRRGISKLGLFNLNEQSAVQAMTTGFVASYLTLEPLIDPAKLTIALQEADKRFFRDQMPPITMSKCWDATDPTKVCAMDGASDLQRGPK